jgi:hypothetical protein
MQKTMFIIIIAIKFDKWKGLRIPELEKYFLSRLKDMKYLVRTKDSDALEFYFLW